MIVVISLQSSPTCNASRRRREGGDDELVGEEEDGVVSVASITQRREVHRHRVGTCAGSAHSAHLRGSWDTDQITVRLLEPDRICERVQQAPGWFWFPNKVSK